MAGHGIWPPLRGSSFAESCRLLPGGPAEQVDELARLAPEFDLIVAVKPFESTFIRSWQATRAAGLPLLLDIDDPDLSAALATGYPLKQFAKSVLKPRQMGRARTRLQLALNTPRVVSNPYLQAQYGGTIVPHPRKASDAGDPHRSHRPEIAFVGTNRRHKGLGILREAVGRLQDEGFSLVITDNSPDDARPWEHWIGGTSLAQGLEVVARSDIVVVPSMNRAWSYGQLPAKLIDAMMLGRAIVVSDIAPLPWAIGDGGLTFRPGSVKSLRAQLARLTDPTFRTELGSLAHQRAEDVFSVSAVAPNFARACLEALSSFNRSTHK